MSEHQKYLREQKAKEDTQQTKLAITINNIAIQKQIAKFRNINFDITMYNKPLICPFCLTVDILEHFIDKQNKQYVKDGIFNKHLALCPNCENHLTWKTLAQVLNMNPTQFADWVFIYSAHGEFWRKIKNFKQWNNRLYEMGFSFNFWKRYKELKGEKTKQYEQEQEPDEYFKERYKDTVELPNEEY
jgi:hypothetical protein